MAIRLNHPHELALLNLVGLSLFRLIKKARSADTSESPGDTRWKWSEETAIGYEASWTGMYQEPEKPNL